MFRDPVRGVEIEHGLVTCFGGAPVEVSLSGGAGQRRFAREHSLVLSLTVIVPTLVVGKGALGTVVDLAAAEGKIAVVFEVLIHRNHTVEHLGAVVGLAIGVDAGGRGP